MLYTLEYPLHSDREDGAWLDPSNIIEFAQTAEAAGVDGIALTDHPAPSKKWLDHGGHETIDPFVGLGFIAAATARIRLMTFLAVVPYRNPLLLAKSMTAVDLLSGGRATFALGTGYLRSEFSALGVNFEERNELFDEAIEVMKGLWATDELQFEGRHFKAVGVTLKPGPVQSPHPPLWLGGNARVVRDRVAAWGQGWAPLLGGATLVKTTRTSPIESDEKLATLIEEIKWKMSDHGRDPETLDVLSSGVGRLGSDASAEAHLEHIGRLAEIGVTWSHVPFDSSSFPAALDSIRRFGEDVIPTTR